MEGKLILVRDERGQWDLPGGKLKKGERLDVCLFREMEEELGIAVRVEKLLDATLRRIEDQVDVLVLLYQCATQCPLAHLRLSSENFAIGFFDLSELDALGLPSPYLEAIKRLDV
ncbi:MAG: NUDIX hydrolase [Haliscomenobacter sp.]|nr:NUDIX hydrolase [Haliscomenobacter sp.]